MASERESRRERRIKRRERKLVGSSVVKGDADISPRQNDGMDSSTLQGVDELADMDDWGSAWKEAQERGEAWGGRGKGGRGIQRNTWQPKDIYVEGVTLAYQGTELLERTTVRLGQGRRYGLIGPNGVGKTTLLRRIAAGAVPGWPLHLRSYLVQQEEMAGNTTCNSLETVMNSDARLTRLRYEAELLEADPGDEAKAPSKEVVRPSAAWMAKLDEDISGLSIEEKVERLEEVYVDLDALEAHDSEGRATSILKGLGFSTNRMLQATAELSGGWMTRLSLACALFCRPDLLLLDEPTNHMDLEGVVWLSKQLTEHIGDTMVLMVSHDAGFLDAVTTDIIHFQLKQLTYYVGNYSAFLKTKADHDMAANRTQDTLDRQRKHLEDSVKKMTKAASGKSGDQKKSDQVASRMKKLGRHGLEKDANGHRWKAQTMANTGSSIRAGCANELTYRGGKTLRRSLGAHVDKETVFKFPDVTPLACSKEAPIVQCRDVSFSFVSSTAPSTAPKARPVSSKKPPSNSRTQKTEACSSKLVAKAKAADGMILEGVTMDLTMKSRVVLVGRNGSGKSTLLRLIAAAAGVGGDGATSGGLARAGDATAAGAAANDKAAGLVPTKGTIVRNYNARVGLFTQHHAERLRMSESALQHMQRVFQGVEGINEAELRRQLGCCGISGSLALQEMRSLSGGQKSRVVLAELMTRRPHLLILDEPTNHLDLPSIDALRAALEGYGGGVVLASHDQALIRGLLESEEEDGDGFALPRGELWEVKARRVRRREGGIDEYLEEITQLAETREARLRAATR